MNKGDELQNLNNKDSAAITKNNQVIKKLVMIVFGMFAFGFALVPLYDVFCDITGLNGKTSTTAAAVYNVDQIDTKRIVTVQFISRTAQGIPWQFEPMVREIKVHPGEMKLVKFYAKNESTRDIIGQAVPSVSPGLAAAYFQKIECFCFTQQPLQANEEVEMALQFYVDPELPEDISTLTLSYTLYDVTGKVES
ncbi:MULTISPECIES: cytochrome c oxidase assembly protein [unclassified Colwellia]|uniref:cytochrome c oxidase assembly protein n=1 Tax=unclassified Colwellia TaxID=196834 RepID=UPI0015F469F4|nr:MULTISPECIES: cytochrome c oxidase assembly protein [unclassified Colwellia]MBA6231099.1 cytochrome c oxidase assembly protein [Colwellia sp. MB02u-7]MBA6235133.1 cytochrome c oxidase assembly protein [Colwellia sp. MB02u-11]MBA6257480.1 cytochrome c oxidase assembly protein [Colwellia sp. MB3u-28]MBA6260552.1 cytochrome c oxidase assembly protein [Colwellia sp. MB3u-41]MBA6301658.1 cytochrome c oxidase assembly protein [Colwellia sp. MB3u-22]